MPGRFDRAAGLEGKCTSSVARNAWTGGAERSGHPASHADTVTNSRQGRAQQRGTGTPTDGTPEDSATGHERCLHLTRPDNTWTKLDMEHVRHVSSFKIQLRPSHLGCQSKTVEPLRHDVPPTPSDRITREYAVHIGEPYFKKVCAKVRCTANECVRDDTSSSWSWASRARPMASLLRNLRNRSADNMVAPKSPQDRK